MLTNKQINTWTHEEWLEYYHKRDKDDYIRRVDEAKRDIFVAEAYNDYLVKEMELKMKEEEGIEDYHNVY
jgi:hypothetical protein